MCVATSDVAEYARRFAAQTLVVSWALTQKRNGTELIHRQTRTDEWDRMVRRNDDAMKIPESGKQRVAQGSSALQTERFEEQRTMSSEIISSGSDETVDVVLSTIISVNQLSVYGAVADLCK